MATINPASDTEETRSSTESTESRNNSATAIENGGAPDGGWGWVVVAASFTIQALTIGVTYTFGVLYVDLLRVFQAGEFTTAWIGSIQPALLYLTGIVASPLTKKLGWRVVACFGSVLSATGFATSALATNVYILYFTYGVLTGIGNGLMYVTSMVVVQHYFEKRRAMATGLAVSGSGVGTFFFAFITRFLLDNVQWRWTLVIEGGMLLLGVVCALTFKALPQPETVDVKQKLFYPSSPVEYATPSEYSSLLPVPDRQSKSSCACCRGFFTSIYEDIFDSNLWRRHAYLLCCACILLFCFGYHVPYTFTPERAHVAYNVSTQRSSTLLSAMGIANVGSRLLFGWVGDFGEEVRYWLGGLVLGLGGVVSVFSSLYITYPLMLLYSVLFGCFTGCWVALYPVILVDLMGVDLIEKSLGTAIAVGSVAFLVAAPISGWIIQETGSYEIPFIAVGLLEVLGAMLFFATKCVRNSRIGGCVTPPSEPVKHHRIYNSGRYSSGLYT